MKKKLSLGFILLVVMIVPFVKAYADFDQPVIAVVSFLLVVVATMTTLFFFLAEPKEENAF